MQVELPLTTISATTGLRVKFTRAFVPFHHFHGKLVEVTDIPYDPFPVLAFDPQRFFGGVPIVYIDL